MDTETLQPFWFKQRQAKAEVVGENVYRLSAPNQQEAYIAIRQEANGRWGASLSLTEDLSDVIAQTTPAYEKPEDAWEASFELYRDKLIV